MPDAIKGHGDIERDHCSHHRILEQRTRLGQHKQEDHQKAWLFESHTGDQKNIKFFWDREDVDLGEFF